MTHGQPHPDLGEWQLWSLIDDAVRNRDLQSTNELIHRLAEYSEIDLEPVIS